MKQRDDYIFVAVLHLLIFFFPLSATVGPIVPGESLWWIVKRIGEAVDALEGKVDLIETSTTENSCGVIELSQATVVGGTLSISTSGSYCLKEDITSDVAIAVSRVQLDMNGRSITGTMIVGASCKYIVVKNGFVTPPQASASGTNGIAILAGSSQIFLENVVVTCAVSSSGMSGCNALAIAGQDVQITTCTVGGGPAGLGGGIGGHGVVMSSGARLVTIQNCTIFSGNGGEGSGGVGGNGGNGIDMRGPLSTIEIDRCILFSTGTGGRGAATFDGGDGGHGVFIDSSCQRVAVHNCTIRDTGLGGDPGSGGAAGAGGKAIADAVPAGGSASKVYANFAHDIANAIMYDLQGITDTEAGSPLSNPPANTPVSVYANVFI